MSVRFCKPYIADDLYISRYKYRRHVFRTERLEEGKYLYRLITELFKRYFSVNLYFRDKLFNCNICRSYIIKYLFELFNFCKLDLKTGSMKVSSELYQQISALF